MDVTNPNTIKAAVTKVQKKLKGKGLGGLINNACVALSGSLLHMPIKIRDKLVAKIFGL